MPMDGSNYSLGMIETWGYPALVAAADAAAKAADVKVVTYQGADAGIVTIYIIGDVASVQAAVAVGEQAAKQVGKLLSSHVIARPEASVPLMIGEAFRTWTQSCSRLSDQSAAVQTNERLEQKSVADLRKLARSFPNFALSGQEISVARKEELIQHLKEWMEKRGETDT